MAGFGLGALDVVDRVRQIQDLDTRLTRLTGSTEGAAEATAYLSKTAKDMSADVLVLSDAYARMLPLVNSNVITTTELRTVVEGYANVQAALGASNTQVEQSLYGLTQALSNGKLQAEELSQITEPLPGLMQALDKSFAQVTGATDNIAGGFRRAVMDGKVTSDLLRNVLPGALAEYNGAAAAAADDISGKLRQINNAYTDLARVFSDRLADPFADVIDAATVLLGYIGDLVDMVVAFRGALADLPVPQWMRDFMAGGPLNVVRQNTGQLGRDRSSRTITEEIREAQAALADLQAQMDSQDPVIQTMIGAPLAERIDPQIAARRAQIEALQRELDAIAAPTADDWMIPPSALPAMVVTPSSTPSPTSPSGSGTKGGRKSTVDKELADAKRLLEGLRNPVEKYLSTLRDQASLRDKLVQAIHDEAQASGQRIGQTEAEARATEVLARGRREALDALKKELDSTPEAVAAAKRREDALTAARDLYDRTRTPEEAYRQQVSDIYATLPALTEIMGGDNLAAMETMQRALDEAKDGFDDLRGAGVKAWSDIAEEMLGNIDTASDLDDVLNRVLLTLLEISIKGTAGLGPAGGLINDALGVSAGGLLGALFGGGRGGGSASGISGLTAADDWMLSVVQPRAKGGATKPGWVMAGEDGPELMRVGSPGYVYPADVTQQIMAGAAGQQGGMITRQAAIAKIEMNLNVSGVTGRREVEEAVATGVQAGMSRVRREVPSLLIEYQRRGTR
ncbi:tape measure protein [Tistrella bauzanensis]